MEEAKIIIIENPQKISPALMRMLQGIHRCKIEFMSADEFKALGLAEKDILHFETVPKLNMDELFEVPEIQPVESLDAVVGKKKNSKPYNPKTIGKVNTKKMTTQQRYNNKRLKSR